MSIYNKDVTEKSSFPIHMMGGEEKKTRQVQQWLNELDAVTQVSKDLSIAIRERLSPVLSCEMVEACGESNKTAEQSPLVAVAESIRSAVYQINSSNRIKQDILNRLEV